MAQAPATDNPATGTSDASTQTADKKHFNSDDASKKLASFGAKMKAFGKKAVDSAAKFVDETDQELTAIKSMEGLVGMASAEFQSYIKQKADTTDKVEKLKQIADSFKDGVGIVFVASFNVAFTVGGSYGRGIVMKRLGPGNWSLPFAIQEIEGNVGWQLNISRMKNFYVLKNDQAIKNFQQKQNVKLGGKGFAAIGNHGIQASGDVKASKESLTKTTNDAKDVAATNASVGSVKGLALGVSVNAGTFQPCKKINDATYNNFDISKLFDNGINDAETSGNNNNDTTSTAINSVKNDQFVAQIQEFIQLMEGVIDMEKQQASDKAAASAAASASAVAANNDDQKNDDVKPASG